MNNEYDHIIEELFPALPTKENPIKLRIWPNVAGAMSFTLFDSDNEVCGGGRVEVLSEYTTRLVKMEVSNAS